MMTLYTAIGHLKQNKDGSSNPSVMVNGREHILDIHEMLLWSILAFQILTFDELKKEFYDRERDLHILGELDFEHYLNRLVVRRLVASGKDCTGVDALYDLLGHLYLSPITPNLFTRFLAFLRLFFIKRIPFRQAMEVFHVETLEPAEKQVLDLAKDQNLSTAELIQCMEKGKRHLRSQKELMNCLYNDDYTDCNNIAITSRFADKQLSTLTAIANLYLKKMILFDVL